MEEISRQLKAARQAQGITVEQAEEETKIRRKYIEALENGSKADLPGEVYLKGFLRTYGNYLGLDGPNLVEEYKLITEGRRAAVGAAAGPLSAPDVAASAEGAETPRDRARQLVEREGSRPRPPLQPRQAAPVTPPTKKAPRVQSTLHTRSDGVPRPQRRPRPQAPSARPVVAAIVALALLAGVGYLGWRLISRLTAPGKPAPVATKPTATNPTPPVGATVPTTTTTTTTTPEAPKPTLTMVNKRDVQITAAAKEVSLRMEFAERVWMKVQVDDQWVYEGFPVAPQEFRGTKLRLEMGHMNGVTLLVNGQRLEHGLREGPYSVTLSAQLPQ